MAALPDILRQAVDAGHTIFENGDYNLNIIGTRSLVRHADRFDDFIHCAYKVDGHWVSDRWAATTDPGLTYLTRPMKASGCAILLPGQYRGSHVVGKHKGKYSALVQDRRMRFVRDDNRNAILDVYRDSDMRIEESIIGCNIHAADLDPFDGVDRVRVNVGPWSAACQVFADSADYRKFWRLVKTSAEKYGPRFTYTLLDMKV